jgi:hypothetical protein
MFKKIPGYTHYSITRSGIVRRDDTGRRLSLKATKKGYIYLALYEHGHRSEWKVHQLVLLTYVGPRRGRMANHKNGVKTDNRVANLEWCTSSHNMKHAFHELGINNLGTGKGEAHCGAKLTNKEVLEIRAMIQTGMTQRVVADIFKVDRSTISLIVSRKRWGHI